MKWILFTKKSIGKGSFLYIDIEEFNNKEEALIKAAEYYLSGIEFDMFQSKKINEVVRGK